MNIRIKIIVVMAFVVGMLFGMILGIYTAMAEASTSGYITSISYQYGGVYPDGASLVNFHSSAVPSNQQLFIYFEGELHYVDYPYSQTFNQYPIEIFVLDYGDSFSFVMTDENLCFSYISDYEGCVEAAILSGNYGYGESEVPLVCFFADDCPLPPEPIVSPYEAVAQGWFKIMLIPIAFLMALHLIRKLIT